MQDIRVATPLSSPLVVPSTIDDSSNRPDNNLGFATHHCNYSSSASSSDADHAADPHSHQTYEHHRTKNNTIVYRLDPSQLQYCYSSAAQSPHPIPLSQKPGHRLEVKDLDSNACPTTGGISLSRMSTAEDLLPTPRRPQATKATYQLERDGGGDACSGDAAHGSGFVSAVESPHNCEPSGRRCPSLPLGVLAESGRVSPNGARSERLTTPLVNGGWLDKGGDAGEGKHTVTTPRRPRLMKASITEMPIEERRIQWKIHSRIFSSRVPNSTVATAVFTLGSSVGKEINLTCKVVGEQDEMGFGETTSASPQQRVDGTQQQFLDPLVSVGTEIENAESESTAAKSVGTPTFLCNSGGGRYKHEPSVSDSIPFYIQLNASGSLWLTCRVVSDTDTSQSNQSVSLKVTANHPSTHRLLWPVPSSSPPQFMLLEFDVEVIAAPVTRDDCKMKEMTASEQATVYSYEYAELFADEKFKDVEIMVGRISFFAHVAILSVASPTFRAIFSRPALSSRSEWQAAHRQHGNALLAAYRESTSKAPLKVPILDLQPSTFNRLLKYIYIGAIPSNWELEAAEYLHAAKRYSLSKLGRYFDIKLSNAVTAATFVRTASLAIEFDLPEAQARIQEVYFRNAEDLHRDEGFRAFMERDSERWLKLISDAQQQLGSREGALSALWAKDRLQHFFEGKHAISDILERYMDSSRLSALIGSTKMGRLLKRLFLAISTKAISRIHSSLVHFIRCLNTLRCFIEF